MSSRADVELCGTLVFLQGSFAYRGGQVGLRKKGGRKEQERHKKVAILSVASNSILIVLKIVVGILIGSVAVISEAIHSAVDLVAALIALFAVRTASQAADERHPYGHGKFENISGTVEGLLIFFAAAWIIYSAVNKAMRS